MASRYVYKRYSIGSGYGKHCGTCDRRNYSFCLLFQKQLKPAKTGGYQRCISCLKAEA